MLTVCSKQLQHRHLDHQKYRHPDPLFRLHLLLRVSRHSPPAHTF